MHAYEDCTYCGGEVRVETRDVDYRKGTGMFIVKNVPAGVCQECGEMYLSAEVTQRMELNISRVKNGRSNGVVPIIAY
ncbi:MAG: type II toxin-antitoxin system MqsA family antitoxin [Candidatus Hydrogenedentes bacterium]|nr:type II toxin-antitoxin system MqsA family antitoxin [Candidatus Hydrogenedentota bacterium]MBI3119741.1 type II toxin-antitoxin system MqsA family antitoxin [Candidatus Hydrogenedentota bacterium]